MKPSDISDEHLVSLISLDEATEDERSEWNRRLKSKPELATELESMRKEEQLITSTLTGGSGDYQVPERILAAVESARAAAVEEVQQKERASNKIIAFRPLLAAAAAIVLLAAAAVTFWKPGSATNPVLVLSPAPQTSTTSPSIVWDAEPDRRFDVWVLPGDANQLDTPPLFVKKDVTSPVSFGALQPTEGSPTALLAANTPYQILICDAGAGRHAGEMVAFRTAAESSATVSPADPAGAFLQIRDLISSENPGDALSLAASLPSEWQDLPEIRTLIETATAAAREVRSLP